MRPPQPRSRTSPASAEPPTHSERPPRLTGVCRSSDVMAHCPTRARCANPQGVLLYAPLRSGHGSQGYGAEAPRPAEKRDRGSALPAVACAPAPLALPAAPSLAAMVALLCARGPIDHHVGDTLRTTNRNGSLPSIRKESSSCTLSTTSQSRSSPSPPPYASRPRCSAQLRSVTSSTPGKCGIRRALSPLSLKPSASLQEVSLRTARNFPMSGRACSGGS